MNDRTEVSSPGAGAFGRLSLAAVALAAAACLLAALVPTSPASALAPTQRPWIYGDVPAHLGFQIYWWDVKSTSERDPTVTGYEVQYRARGATTWLSKSHSGTLRAAEFSGLNAGTRYEVRVRATNSDGNSVWSWVYTSSAVTSNATTANPPFPVQVEAGDAQVRVTWGQPSHSGGQTLTGYVVRLYSPGTTLLRRITVSGAGTTSHEITGLTNGREYTIDVFAVAGEDVPDHLQDQGGLVSPPETFTPSGAMAPRTAVTLWPRTLSIDEGGSGSFTVALTGDPGSSLTVTFVKVPYVIDPVTRAVRYSFEKDVATVTPATLTFTSGQSGNYATPKSVTVTGAEDDDARDEQLIVLLMVVTTSAGQNTSPVYEPVGGIGNSIVGVRVTIEDDERPGGQQSSPPNEAVAVRPATVTPALGRASVGEKAGRVTVTATLDAPAPAGGDGISLALRPAGGSTATRDADYTLPDRIVIAAGQRSGSASITIIDDAVDESGETLTVGVLADTGYAVLSAEATLTITDDDTAGVTVRAASPLSVSEGAMATYTVVLDSRPTADVTVTASSGDGDAVSVSPVSHTFTPSSWNRPVTFTVRGVADTDSDDETVSISHRVTSDDPKYAAATASAVSVSVSDTTPEQQDPGNDEPEQEPSDGELTVSAPLADLSLRGPMPREVSLSGVFSSDGLIISAISSNHAIASMWVSLDDSTLWVVGISTGTATITVTAKDADGNQVSDDFEVTVAPF